eukprot:TRINITY_DN47000_c0_g1_i1.p1 TRINITY_DN47000_c0_g1~~TRINITY_DN47000_c0_g1_i1.p1  ORF type:complete len:603 (+),score=105.85 TRINITY_DN47000_c0_g1_i1:72-1880(+)
MQVEGFLQQKKQFITKPITFTRAHRPDPQEVIRGKLVPLNDVDTGVMRGGKVSSGTAASRVNTVDAEEDEEIRPRHYLSDPRTVDSWMQWSRVATVGCGLVNTSNNCFLNSVLQCLTHIPAFRNFIASVSPSPRYKDAQGFDVLAIMQAHFNKLGTTNAIHPKELISNLRRLSKTFRPGRQEDAQEFCLHLLEACHDSLLRAVGTKVDRNTAETTAVHQIFGGWLRSQIKWDKEEEMRELQGKQFKQQVRDVARASPNTSDTFDPYLMLSVELKGGSLDKCLAHFTKSETLDAQNKYKTPAGAYVIATKRLSIHRRPRVLIVHLKRFTAFGRKIKNTVEYPEVLDISPYCSKPGKSRAPYRLSGVVVHQGSSMHAGHYYSYIRSSNNLWYCMNDQSVTQASVDRALSQEAYLLFYVAESLPSGDTPKKSATETPERPQKVAAGDTSPAAPGSPEHSAAKGAAQKKAKKANGFADIFAAEPAKSRKRKRQSDEPGSPLPPQEPTKAIVEAAVQPQPPQTPTRAAQPQNKRPQQPPTDTAASSPLPQAKLPTTAPLPSTPRSPIPEAEKFVVEVPSPAPASVRLTRRRSPSAPGWKRRRLVRDL